MSKNSVFTAQFFRMKKSVSIDGLIGCIEKATGSREIAE